MKRRKPAMLITLLVLMTLGATGFLFMRQDVFGRDPAGERQERILRSPHYRDGQFQNLMPTAVMREDASYRTMILDYFNKSDANTPPHPLPSVRTDLRALPGTTPTVVWFGHSSYLIRAKDITVLVDPVLSGHASPVSFFGRAFAGTDPYRVDDLPDIDLLILSHDHYDHLDYATIRRLIPNIKRFYTALGVGAHLERWGVPTDRITEFDWWDRKAVTDSVVVTAAPARHFSGRSFARGKTLWTAFVLELPGYRLFLGGDSGYGPHFAEIGRKYGPFDLAVLECGQYGADWPNIHMFPEEVVTAAQELGAKTLLPVHWAKFALAYHAWNEPIQRLVTRAAEQRLDVTTPRIGEPVVLDASYPKSVWWNF